MLQMVSLKPSLVKAASEGRLLTNFNDLEVSWLANCHSVISACIEAGGGNDGLNYSHLNNHAERTSNVPGFKLVAIYLLGT